MAALGLSRSNTVVVSLAPFLLIAVPLALVVVGIVIAIVLVIVRLARRPTTVAPPSTVGPGGPPSAGSWNAHLRRDGRLDAFSGFGTLTLFGGWLTFVPEGTTTPAWSYPAVWFGVGSRSGLANSDLTLDSRPTGPLGLTVSHQRINRVSENDFKFLGQRADAAEFAQAMRASGATILD